MLHFYARGQYNFVCKITWIQRLRSGRRSKSGRMKTGIENTGYLDEDADNEKYYVEQGNKL